MEIMNQLRKGIRKFMAKNNEYVDNVIDKLPSNGFVRVQSICGMFGFIKPYAIARPWFNDISLKEKQIKCEYQINYPWVTEVDEKNGYLNIPHINGKPLCRFEKIRMEDYFKMSQLFRKRKIRYNLKKASFIRKTEPMNTFVFKTKNYILSYSSVY